MRYVGLVLALAVVHFHAVAARRLNAAIVAVALSTCYPQRNKTSTTRNNGIVWRPAAAPVKIEACSRRRCPVAWSLFDG